MEEMALHNVCLETKGSRPTIRLIISRLVTYHGENALLASLETHSQMDLVNNIYKDVVYAT
jgi:hypothetical protein